VFPIVDVWVIHSIEIPNLAPHPFHEFVNHDLEAFAIRLVCRLCHRGHYHMRGITIRDFTLTPV
jgi:hypothetical protein